MSDLLKEMIWSAKELHTSLESDLLKLEKNNHNRKLIDNIYRSFHSLKGAAGLTGLPLFEIVTHEGEALLTIYRNNPQLIQPEGVELLIIGVDLVKQLLKNLDKNGQEGAVDISDFVVEMTAHSALLASQTDTPQTDTAQANGGQPNEQENKAPLTENVQINDPTSLDGNSQTHEGSEQQPAPPFSEPVAPATMPVPSPSPEHAGQNTSNVSYPSMSIPLTQVPQTLTTTLPINDHEAMSPAGNSSTTNKSTPAVQKGIAPSSLEGGSTSMVTTSRGADTTVRVNIELLDQLMNQVGELVLARNQVLQSVAGIGDPKLQSTTRVLDQVTSELQECVMQTRMQPISVITDKFPRIVRDLSRMLGKQVEIEIEGRDTELDRTIVEAVRDPFTHILRNSIDHGLELPDARQAAGKPPTGTVTIRAFHESGQVIVEVLDDGQGVHVERVKAKAIERGLITEEQSHRMSDAEAVNLICHPGLSTAEQVTNISGRGVGMDVVRSNIEKIGGSLDIQSVRGQGTTVRIKIPLTLAIIPALMVGIGDRMFGIPQVNLIELVGLSRDEASKAIEQVRGAHVFRLRERLLTVIQLSEVLEIKPAGNAHTQLSEPSSSSQPTNSDHQSETGTDDGGSSQQTEDDMLYVVVVSAGDHHFGLVVEEIFDTEEIVVKPLSKHLSTIEHFAGATIRGDGSVSLILDIAGIARDVDMQISSSGQFSRIGHDGHDGNETILEDDFLVFNLTEHDQYAIPLQLVARIEQYPVSALTRINGKPAITSGGTILPAILMNELLQTDDPEFDDLETIYAIVVSAGSGVGFVARSLVDITAIQPDAILESADFNIDELASGAAVIQEIPTILLDVFKLIDRLFPSNRRLAAATTNDSQQAPSILFAEDAPFFQGVVANYLKDAGYQTKVCDDGQQAFDHLVGPGCEHFDLILTDLEMPKMNGWELIEKLRQTDDYRQIPIIALTSLTDDESKRRAIECGASDYRVKLNRDELLEAMSEALG